MSSDEIRNINLNDTCLTVGPALPDVAGIGILASFSGQAFLSLVLSVWVFFLSEMGALDVRHDEQPHAVRRKARRLAAYSDMLLVGNDIQLLLGIAYMVTTWMEREKIGLYHQRLTFDTVSLVAVSSTSALVCSAFCHVKLKRELDYRSFRYMATGLFALCYCATALIVLTDLRSWSSDPDAGLGRCYITHMTSIPGSPHPTVDMFYVAITSFALMVSMLSGAFVGPRRRKLVLMSAFVHFPLHFYFMVAVRHANQDYLVGGADKEDDWDFGQTTAMSLLVVAVAEVAEKWWQYRQWVRHDGKGMALLHVENPVDDGVWPVYR